MKRRADGEGVESLLIMCDGEGHLGDPDPARRTRAVENHHKWVEAAAALGCHSIRVNAAGGGDVYYLSSCASGRITRLLLADVSGHGAGVAGLAVSLRDLMRRHVNLIDQTRFVREMNRQFSAALETDRFATAVVCTYFSPRRSLQICCAGHPPPLIYRQAKGAWAYAGDSGADADGPVDLPLGVLPTADYTRLETTLNRGDLLLCYSDAFTESVDAVGAPLGAAGLLEAVAQTDATRPHTVAPTLIERLKQADPQNLDQDDATVILVQAVDSTPSLGDSLLAPVRLLGTARDRTDVR